MLLAASKIKEAGGANRLGWLWGCAGMLGVAAPLLGQGERGYIMQSAPYPVYSTPDTANYNLKYGNMIARFNAGAQTEYNDNINLSHTDPRWDLSFGPNVSAGFLLPITKENLLQLDLGAGYRWYLNSPSLSSVTLAPNSRLDYRMFVGNLSLNFHDAFSVQNDPVSRPEITGGNSQIINFRRFQNTLGTIAEWRAFRQWAFIGGYDYSLDRSMTSDFQNLDCDQHSLSLGTYYQMSSKMSVGVNGSYSMTLYQEKVQNDGNSKTIGPFVSWEVNRFISLDASVGYSVSSFGHQGTVTDTSSFQGMVFQVGARHRINSRMSQNLRVGRSSGQGFGSNFTDSYSAQHGFTWQLNRALGLNSTLSFQHYSASSGGDAGNQYLYYLGLSYKLSRNWSTAGGYAFAWKTSDLPDRDYNQNRLTFEVHRRF
jgi:hypothetical protein